AYGLTVNAPTGASSNYAAEFLGGNVGIGDSSPAALLTVGNGDLFQVNSSGAIAAVVGITNSSTYNTNTFTSSALTFGAASTATVDSASGQTLQLGTTNATSLTLGNTANTTAITLQGTAGATYTIG